jgi:hypothetical protein
VPWFSPEAYEQAQIVLYMFFIRVNFKASALEEWTPAFAGERQERAYDLNQ